MAGTFWSNFGLRFNPASSSNGIDELLEKGEGHFTLSEVLLHDQCIQEAKYMNLQLCEYLSQPKIVTQLVQYIITVPPDAREAAQNPNEVGGGIDTNGSITTAASIKKKAEKAKAAVAAAAAAAAAKEAAAASSPSSSDAAASSADAAAPAASSPADGPTTLDLAAQSGSPPEAKTDAESSDSFTHSSESDSDEENDDSPRSTAARAASKAASDAEAAADAEQKFPYLASELFACEVPTMLDTIFDDGEALSRRDSVNVSATSASTTLENVAEDAPAEESKDAAATASAAATAASSTSSPPASAISGTSPSSASASASSSSSSRRLPILDLLLSFLDQPAPIDPAHASYFRKVMVVLIQRKYEPLVKYMSAHGTLDKLLRHVGLYSMMELLIMIGWDDGLGGNQDVAWLVQEDLTGKLLAKLHPRWELEEKQPDVLINASRALVDVVVKCPASTHNPLITRLLATPCLTELFSHMFSGAPLSLSNALSIVIVLVQRYANRMDLGEQIMDETKAAALAAQAASLDAPEDEAAAAAAAAAASAASDASGGANKLPEPFHSLVPHLARILRLLDSEAPPIVRWSYGPGRAFGETRLKVVELILVLVRCKVSEVEQIFVEERLMEKLLDAFFLYPWNNMLHGLVESIIRTTLEFLGDTVLKPALFIEAKLVPRVLAAYAANVAECKKGAGFRLGYMGHLLRTADVIEQYLLSLENPDEEDPDTTRARVLGSAEVATQWKEFVAGPLTAESESQKVVLPNVGAGDDDDFGPGDDMSGGGGSSGGGDSFKKDSGASAQQQQQAATDSQQDYAFDPDDTGNLAYDYSSQMESGNEWADFSSHFSEASIGESPNQIAGGAGGAAGGSGGSPTRGSSDPSGGLSSLANQRKLMEFSLNPDEDDDGIEEVEGEAEEDEGAAAGAADKEEWAKFDSSAQASAAAAAPSSDANAAASASAPASDSSAAPAAAAPAAAASSPSNDDFADFAVHFPAGQ